MTPNSPEDLFRSEKARSQSERGSTHALLLAEAKAAFDKLMAEGQAARKSGRPRKNPLPPLMAVVPVEPAPKIAAVKQAAAKQPAAKKPAAKKSAPPKAAKKAAPKKATTQKSAGKTTKAKPAKKSAKKPVAKKTAAHGKRR